MCFCSAGISSVCEHREEFLLASTGQTYCSEKGNSVQKQFRWGAFCTDVESSILKPLFAIFKFNNIRSKRNEENVAFLFGIGGYKCFSLSIIKIN